MTKLGLLGAAAVIVSSALTAPAMAQQVIDNPGKCAQFYPNANCQNLGPGNPYTSDGYRRSAYRTSNGYYRQRDDSGFWPADVAAGVVGGAIGTAGAIATAPFRDDSYAYYNGDGGYDRSYAQRNGFVCQPGTWFRGEDGRPHICQ